MIVISLCAEDLKPHLKKNEKNGKHYISLVVDTKKEPDNYGNTHAVYASQTKEQRAAKTPKQFVGNGKEYTSQHSRPTPETTTSKEFTKDEIEEIELPF
jgi:hypothetical protein